MATLAAKGSMSPYTYKELPDPEVGRSSESLLVNDIVKTFAWDSISVTVKDRATKKPRLILSDVNGHVKAGLWHLPTFRITLCILTSSR